MLGSVERRPRINPTRRIHLFRSPRFSTNPRFESFAPTRIRLNLVSVQVSRASPSLDRSIPLPSPASGSTRSTIRVRCTREKKEGEKGKKGFEMAPPLPGQINVEPLVFHSSWQSDSDVKWDATTSHVIFLQLDIGKVLAKCSRD